MVTASDGRPTRATNTPLKAPSRTQSAITIGSAVQNGRPHSEQAAKITAPNATSAACERSISPRTTTTIRPSASMPATVVKRIASRIWSTFR